MAVTNRQVSGVANFKAMFAFGHGTLLGQGWRVMPAVGTTPILRGLSGDLRRVLKADLRVFSALRALLTNRGLQSVILYRVSRVTWKAHIPLVPLALTRIAQILYGIDIAYTADLGPGIVIFHGVGLVIGSEVEIKGDCILYQGVTLGDRGSEWVGSDRPDGHPRVGRDVIFGAGAKVLGPITIGDNCVIGANAVVLKDIPPNSIVAGVPAKVVGTRDVPSAAAAAEVTGVTR